MKTIYFYKGDSMQDENSVCISQTNNGFVAMTRAESKTFKTLNGAKRWMEKRGYFISK